MATDSLKKCVLMRHGLMMNNQGKLGICCYNPSPSRPDSGYHIDPIQCRHCLDQEDNGIYSYRQGSNQKFGLEHDHDGILVLDVTPNINCNLACSICSPQSSSTWSKFKSIPIDSKMNMDLDKFSMMIEKYDLIHLREINFSGGEPWLNNNMQRYIDQLDGKIDFSKITLRFSTNGTHQLTPRMTKFLEKFQLVMARFSLDDIEKYHEYQRYPSKWNQWESNWRYIINNFPPNTIPSINRTVSIFNIARLDCLEKWHGQYSISIYGDPIELIDHFACGFYSLDHLPQKLKEHVLATQGKHSRAWSYVKNRVGKIDNNTYLRNSITKQDQERSISLQAVDPVLYSIIFS